MVKEATPGYEKEPVVILQGHMAVSYTHLDVYKRQYLHDQHRAYETAGRGKSDRTGGIRRIVIGLRNGD